MNDIRRQRWIEAPLGVLDASSRPRPGSAAVVIALIAILAGCASASPPPASPLPAEPAIDGVALARGVESGTALERPYRLFFHWSLTEPGTRLGGEGVARLEPPYRARLDLFLSDNYESVALAVMVGDELTVRSEGGTRLPPPALLWGVLGVFRPGVATLQGGRSGSEGMVELRYLPTTGGEELVYYLRGGRVERVDVLREGRRREELRLTRVEGERFPRIAVYRHLDEVRQLEIVLDSVEYVESYPTDTWLLP